MFENMIKTETDDEQKRLIKEEAWKTVYGLFNEAKK
jgi:hypothetical protein